MPVTLARLTSPESEYESSAQQPGLLPAVPGWSRSTLALTGLAQTLLLTRYRADRDISIRAVQFVTTVASGGNDACEIALFSQTGKLLQTTGSTSGKLNATAGLQTIAIPPSTVYADTVFYVGFVAYTVNASAPTLASANMGVSTPIFAPTFPNVEYGTMASQSSMPSTVTIAVGSSSNYPLIAVRS